MKIIPLIKNFTNNFNEILCKDVNYLNIESKICKIGDNFTLELYKSTINDLDEKFKYSKERKERYNIKETRQKTLITSLGVITVQCTAYIDRETGERYVYLRDILDLKPYQRLTNEAEYRLIKYAMEENMSQAAKHALRNTPISRSTVSKKIKNLKGSVKEDIKRCEETPETLYIEMDEVHANLQQGGNKICPCAIVHEGYKETFVKRKELKNIRYFASSKLTYEELWEVIYDYVDKRYDIDKIKYLFISGDGAKGIKNFTNCFPQAIFVLDIFHYSHRHLDYIFKTDTQLKKMADEYLRNDMINEFNELVDAQIKLYPEQEKYMIQHRDYLLNNIDGIKNQKHPEYKCHCSMEGHVNHGFARYITSLPFGFSSDGLENKLKLLVCHKNKYELKIEDYYNLKYGEDIQQVININMKKLTNIKYNQKLTTNTPKPYKNHNTSVPKFDSTEQNVKLNEIIAPRKEIYII